MAGPMKSSIAASRGVVSTSCLALLLLLGLSTPLAAADVNATLGVDPTGLAGTDGQGRVLLFAPNPLQQGSSVSHWDRSAQPNLLMEPSTSGNLQFGRVDLTRPLLQDMGWRQGSSNVILRVSDPPGMGFNDPQLGAQRLAAAQFAADTWGNQLGSSVTINIDIGFQALSCGNSGAVLAQAGPQFIFDNFAGAPVGGTWYHGALAESLSGQNLSLQDVSNPNAGELEVTFNSAIDTGCLGSGTGYYYGLDGNLPQGNFSFVAVALHEFAHGLGFSSLANESTGAFFLGQPDAYSRFLLDNVSNLRWDQMSAGQRVASAINTGHLVWSGQRVTNQAPNFLQPGPALTINSPASVAGRYPIGTAEFGPALGNPGVSGDLVVARDGSANPTLACQPLINGPQILGRIALVDRGQCNFTAKVRNAQQAGARGVIVINNQGGGTVQMGGTDGSITIPSVSVSRADGQLLLAALEASDPPGTLRFTGAGFQVAEDGGSVTVGVERADGTEGAVGAGFTTVDGSASAGEDYTATSGMVAFADGEGGSQTISIPIRDDALSEDAESFTIELRDPTGGVALGSPSRATVHIADDEPCIASDTVNCLGDGRFRVTVTWRDFDDEAGDGHHVAAASDDSTLLWFFDEANWEMLVKVIDGCGFNQHFWVFAAATTNVEYTLRVTDTLTGEVASYTNPLGTAAPALTDIEALDTCP